MSSIGKEHESVSAKSSADSSDVLIWSVSKDHISNPKSSTMTPVIKLVGPNQRTLACCLPCCHDVCNGNSPEFAPHRLSCPSSYNNSPEPSLELSNWPPNAGTPAATPIPTPINLSPSTHKTFTFPSTNPPSNRKSFKATGPRDRKISVKQRRDSRRCERKQSIAPLQEEISEAEQKKSLLGLLADFRDSLTGRVTLWRRKSLVVAAVIDELELPPTEYRPDESPQKLAEITGFSTSEIKQFYRAFKTECPTGVVSEMKFTEAFAKFYPTSDSTQFAQYVFLTMDPTCTGAATFGTYVQLLATLLLGSLHDRLSWVFSLFDIDKDGRITHDDVYDITHAILELVGSSDPNRKSQILESAVTGRTELFFQKFGCVNPATGLTKERFVSRCIEDRSLQQSMAMLLDL